MNKKIIGEDIKVATVSADKPAENEYRMITAFERFLEDECEYDSPHVVREYPEPSDLYEERLYDEVATGDCFLLCDDDTNDARELAEELLRSEIDELGVDYISDWSSYIDDDKMYDMMKESVEDMVCNEDDSWVISEMESRGIISDEDKVADGDDDDEPQYPESLIDERRDDLIDAIVDEWADSPTSYFTEFLGDSLRELVHANMDLIDIDRLVEDALDYDGGVASILDTYNGRGVSFEFTDADGKVHSVTAYQR